MSERSRVPLEQVWDWLSAVPDPEIPAISVVDLGVVRGVAWDGDTLVVAVTPTYSGCPAATVINLDIERALRDRGVGNVKIERRLSPAWTTDWISREGRDKLRAFGIAPPVERSPADAQTAARASRLTAGEAVVACPRCGSKETEKISQFGSTPCKAHFRCRDCLEPFDHFKCI